MEQSREEVSARDEIEAMMARALGKQIADYARNRSTG